MTPRSPLLRRGLDREEGTTLIELVVGMALMAIFLGMFTGAIVMMNTAMNKSQAVNLSATQLNTAFLNMDKTVRYAAFITTPGVGTSGDWYVELRVVNLGTEVCNQYRVDIATQQLQRRTWTVTDAAASTATAWVPLSSNISNGAAAAGATTQPFYLEPPVPNSSYQQLTVQLVSPAGSGASLTNSTSTFTFTALNSTATTSATSTTPICQQQGRP